MIIPPIQELGQSDIALLQKVELRDRHAAIRKAFDKETKEKEQVKQKQAVDKLTSYFEENKDAKYFIGSVDVDANNKVQYSPSVEVSQTHAPVDLTSDRPSCKETQQGRVRLQRRRRQDQNCPRQLYPSIVSQGWMGCAVVGE